MRINNKIITNTDDILQELKLLPSAFQNIEYLNNEIKKVELNDNHLNIAYNNAMLCILDNAPYRAIKIINDALLAKSFEIYNDKCSHNIVSNLYSELAYAHSVNPEGFTFNEMFAPLNKSILHSYKAQNFAALDDNLKTICQLCDKAGNEALIEYKNLSKKGHADAILNKDMDSELYYCFVLRSIEIYLNNNQEADYYNNVRLTLLAFANIKNNNISAAEAAIMDTCILFLLGGDNYFIEYKNLCLENYNHAISTNVQDNILFYATSLSYIEKLSCNELSAYKYYNIALDIAAIIKLRLNFTTVTLEKNAHEICLRYQSINKLEQYINYCIYKYNNHHDHYEKMHYCSALGAAHSLIGVNEASIEYYDALYQLIQATTIIPNAHRVAQGEIGFSMGEMIGTDNIIQCVVVVVHDPITKRTAMAHVDLYTDPTSLSEYITNKMPQNIMLDTYIIGGKLSDDLVTNFISTTNVKKILDELVKMKNIYINSSDIYNKNIPQAIVFDPQTAEFINAVPGKFKYNSCINIIKTNLYKDDCLKKLFCVLDESDDSIPEIEDLLTTNDKKNIIIKTLYHLDIKSTEFGLIAWNYALIIKPYVNSSELLMINDKHLVAETIMEVLLNRIKHITTESNLEYKYIITNYKDIEDLLRERVNYEVNFLNNPFMQIYNNINNLWLEIVEHSKKEYFRQEELKQMGWTNAVTCNISPAINFTIN